MLIQVYISLFIFILIFLHLKIVIILINLQRKNFKKYVLDSTKIGGGIMFEKTSIKNKNLYRNIKMLENTTSTKH
jgi:hypothetical protein